MKHISVQFGRNWSCNLKTGFSNRGKGEGCCGGGGGGGVLVPSTGNILPSAGKGVNLF